MSLEPPYDAIRHALCCRHEDGAARYAICHAARDVCRHAAAVYVDAVDAPRRRLPRATLIAAAHAYGR